MADNDMHYNGSSENINRTIPDINLPPVPPSTGPIGPDPGGSNWLLPEDTPEAALDYYGQVRFINASTYPVAVNIAIDDTVYASNSWFASVSEYGWVADGFHTVTVRRSFGPRTLLYQQTLPFVAGQMNTMILTDTSAGGMELINVSDSGCRNLPYNVSCFRFANMSYSGSDFDLLLSNGEMIFNHIDFQSVSPYKQAIAGTYRFMVTNSTLFPVPRDLPVIVISNVSQTIHSHRPLTTFDAELTAGQNMTAYVIGHTWSDAFPLQVIVVPDIDQTELQPFTATS